MTTKEERQHGFTFSDAGRALHDGRITTNDTKHVARQITESLFAHPNAEQITNAERKINEHRTRIAQEHRNGPDWIGSLQRSHVMGILPRTRAATPREQAQQRHQS